MELIFSATYAQRALITELGFFLIHLLPAEYCNNNISVLALGGS
jgi:hypothetical protein